MTEDERVKELQEIVVNSDEIVAMGVTREFEDGTCWKDIDITDRITSLLSLLEKEKVEKKDLRDYIERLSARIKELDNIQNKNWKLRERTRCIQEVINEIIRGGYTNPEVITKLKRLGLIGENHITL